jgi:hypothetical protein
VIDGWVTALSAEIFPQVLPLLRRTFATFQQPERRSLGERVRSPGSRIAGDGTAEAGPFDSARGEATLPLVGQLLGLTEHTQ